MSVTDDFAALEELATDASVVARPSPEAAERVRELTKACQEGDLRIASLEAELSREKADQVRRLTVELPAAMEEAKIIDVTYPTFVPGQPDVNLSRKPYYNANIASSWDEDRRRASFDFLDEIGAGDLIKTVVMIPFAREMRKTALDLANGLRQRGYAVEVDESVNHMTLTKWLKERSQKETVPLDTLQKIGGTVGRIAVLKPIEDGKAAPVRSSQPRKRR